jgi:hypothetical protein
MKVIEDHLCNHFCDRDGRGELCASSEDEAPNEGVYAASNLQLMALAMDRGWESPVRINGGFMFVPICSEWPPMELSVRANGAVADDCNR